MEVNQGKYEGGIRDSDQVNFYKGPIKTILGLPKKSLPLRDYNHYAPTKLYPGLPYHKNVWLLIISHRLQLDPMVNVIWISPAQASTHVSHIPQSMVK